LTGQFLNKVRAHKVWTVVVVVIVVALVQLLVFAVIGGGDSGVDTGQIRVVL
jgi:uncharacterized integral membrane protein